MVLQQPPPVSYRAGRPNCRSPTWLPIPQGPRPDGFALAASHVALASRDDYLWAHSMLRCHLQAQAALLHSTSSAAGCARAGTEGQRAGSKIRLVPCCTRLNIIHNAEVITQAGAHLAVLVCQAQPQPVPVGSELVQGHCLQLPIAHPACTVPGRLVSGMGAA